MVWSRSAQMSVHQRSKLLGAGSPLLGFRAGLACGRDGQREFPWGHVWADGIGSRFLSAETQVTLTQPFECGAVRSHDVSIHRFCSRNQPGVVFTHPLGGAALQKRATPCLREMQTLDCK